MIRKFEISDLERILELEKQCFPKTAFSKKQFRDYYKKFPGSFLVYENENEIIGYIVSTENHVESILVDPKHRRKGIGTGLMNEIIKRNEKISLEVRESNLEAREFYKKLGFEVTAVTPYYYGDEDGYQMTLNKENIKISKNI